MRAGLAKQITAGAQDYLNPSNVRDIAVATDYTSEDDPPASLEFLQLAQMLMTTNSLQMPKTIQEALDLYVILT